MVITQLTGYNETKTLEFHDKNVPNGKPLLLQVWAQESLKGKQAFREMQLNIWELMKDENNIEELDGKKNLKVEHLNNLGVEFISKLVESWDGLFDEKGKKVKFDRELLKQAILNVQELGVEIEKFSKDIEGKYLQTQGKTL